ncbi:MAG TPA: RDD family protein [Propionibacteriaceae bacterium]|nr:RDD family protein [Propionibacteriaceae bacterium]
MGTYTPLLAGVARASAVRGYVAVLIDVLPLAVAAAFAAVAAAADEFRTVALIILLSVVFVVAQALLFVRRGRSLGRLVLRLRTVDDLTGNPVGFRKIMARLITSHRVRRTVTADLARGRDPLTSALPPLPGSALAEGIDEAVFAASGQGATALPTSDSVAIVFDTGRRQVIHASLLIGRSPENNRVAEQRGATPATGELPLLALADLSRTLSKTHALLEWSGSVLWVTDLHSANGSVLISPDGERRPLVPGIRGPAAIGWTVECGNRSFSVHAVPQRAAS